MHPNNRRPVRRLALSGALAVALVTGVAQLPAEGGSPRSGSLLSRYDATKAQVLEGKPHVDPPGSKPHTHNDPATKNAVSRSAETAADPTTPEQRRASIEYVASQRRLADPQLTTVPVTPPRTRLPRNRYAMANGCYTLANPSGTRFVKRTPAGIMFKPVAIRSASRFFFKPTALGTYLLYGKDGKLLAGPTISVTATPSTDTEWTVTKVGKVFTFQLADTKIALAVNGTRLVTGPNPSGFRLIHLRGCRAYPEAQIDIEGDPAAGITPYQEVRGYVDAHTHGMAFEFLGGEAHCGRPWHKYGAAYALVDCPDHEVAGGYGGILETVLSGEPQHDPVGWPTFKDWPAPESLTHEGTYYRWLERSWRGGQRIFVNLLVENNQLCQLYPYKRNSCNDMDSVRLQAADMYAMQDYIDAQFGGPGKGFYRIVKNPWQARKVINAGKMAVIMGIETSVPFGCTMKLDVPACDLASIDRQLDEVHQLGVRQMELVNKFDNALSGVAGDSGAVGTAVNAANFAETGSFWDMQHCVPPDGVSHDKNQTAVPDISAGQQDALFGAIASLGLPTLALPIYPPPDHCNSRGLTTLGAATIEGLAKRHMIFDPDHMSVRARNTALDQIDAMGYPGVVSSHSWSTPDAYPRIYQQGGFITPYAGDSTGFVDKWRTHVAWADPRFYWGIGYGADMNGLGAQGDPRGADVPNPVRYPFKGMNGVTVHQQHAGQRVYDINLDGVAQYGLYPDWIQDAKLVAGADGAALEDDLARGAEAYLQMWERAEGIAPDSCRNAELRVSVAKAKRLVRKGMSLNAVMRAVGQPYTRLGQRSTFCATKSGKSATIVVKYTPRGKVEQVSVR